jgi:hypothetical protein
MRVRAKMHGRQRNSGCAELATLMYLGTPELQEIYDIERQMLYVACTQARDHRLVASVEPALDPDADGAEGGRVDPRVEL